MQPNKTKLALQIGTVILGAACASSVLADSFNVTVNTLDDVTLAQVTPMAFGTSILTAASGTCAMDASVPGNVLMNGDGVVAQAGYGGLAGAGCVTGAADGTPGLYTITGEPTLAVNVTVTSEAQVGNFTFSPTGGCAVNYDNATATAATDDPCTPLVVATPLVVNLPGATDTLATAGEGYFTVGGTIVVGVGGLPSDTANVATFLVDVVY